MLIGRIANCTRTLGAPKGWDQDAGTCVGLPIQDIATEAGPAMMSVWEPTPDELERIAKGAKVTLTVYGTAHPPVMLSVGMEP